MASLVGKWKLVREGSDIMPGIENAPGSPLVLKLLGDSTAEFYKIEKKKTLDIEEISLSYVVKNVSINKSIQVGTLNFEQVAAQDITLGIVQNIDENFKEFTLVRLGPKCGQSSKEVYRLDSSNNQIKLNVEIISDGTKLSMTKYLTRYEDTPLANEIMLRGSISSQGWRIFEFWPSTILGSTKVSLVKAVKIKTQSPPTNAKIVETVWSRKAEDGDTSALDLSSISHQFGYQLSEGEEVVEFVIKVSCSEQTWLVAHRYKEFDALRRFLLLQNPHVNEFKACDAKFPGKAVGLSFRKHAMESRVEGLEHFVVFFLENARYCRQNSVDALCSFLKIPENLSSTAKTKQVDAAPASAASTVVAAAPTKSTPTKSIPPSLALPAPTTAASTSTATVNSEQQRKVDTTSAAKPAAVSSVKQTVTPVVAGPAPSVTTTLTTTSSSTSDSVSQTISSSTSRAKQVARESIFGALEKGMYVLKHGRQGAPKTRLLQCDANVTKLFWQSEGKAIFLDEVLSIRTGSDVDRDSSSPAALAIYDANGGANGKSAEKLGVPPTLHKRKSIRQMIQLDGPDEDVVLYGSTNLRRHCRPENLPLCIVLDLPDRTFDIQCSNQGEFDLLYHNLVILLKK